MKKYAVLLLTLSINLMFAQWQDKVIFSVEGDEVTAGEFAAVYNKNREIGQEVDPKTPEEYLELYINFMLKVKDAERQGLDTLPSVRNEFLAYRGQLAKPYLMDKNLDERLVFEAYERSKTDIRASHIMVAVDENAAPADTLRAHQKITRILKELAPDNSNFGALAKKYSDDEYSAKRDGDLGYFSVFHMVYPFESAAYQTDVNKVSRIVRSRFGYHIVMPTDKRIARGTIRVAHIMTIANDKSTPEQVAAAEARINEVYKKVKAGESFETLARQYSEDRNTANSGGELQSFGINDMVPAFEDAAFALQRKGDVSEPVRTPYGWHIIKVLERTGPGNFEEVKPSLAQRVQRDERSNISRRAAIDRLKSEYNFQVNQRNLDRFINGLPKNFMTEGYEVPERLQDAPLFSLGTMSNGQLAFAKYISENWRNVQGDSKEGIALAHFRNWVDEQVLVYEDANLEAKYPEFRYLVNEYRNGILLFELMEKQIWRPSMTDTIGLAEFFEANQSSFQWPDRARIDIYLTQDAKLAKKLQKRLGRNKSVEKLINKATKNSPLAVRKDSAIVTKGTYAELDEVWGRQTAVTGDAGDNMRRVIHVKEILPAGPKELKEAWGAASAAYQVELEEQWVDRLRGEFEVIVHQDVFEKVKPQIIQNK
jgi:peptidyl-prolyl cis-trans isomerase SurA